MNNYIYEDELYHHGIKGQKWGNRKYQNADGSLTEAGKKRYGYGEKRGTIRNETKRQRAFNDMYKDIDKGAKRAEKFKNKEDKHYDKFVKAAEKGNDRKFDKHLDKSNDAMGKKEQALKDVDEASKRMTQGAVKALNMTAKEIDYRKAKRDYDNFTSKAA